MATTENDTVETTVVLEAKLLDYSPATVLQNPFRHNERRGLPWGHSGNFGASASVGSVQLFKRSQHGSAPTYWLRFRDVHVRNDRDLPLYVLLSRLSAPKLDEPKALRQFDNKAETVLLDIGPDGQWKGSQLPSVFEQELSLFDPLVFASVVICKPSAAKPPSVVPLVFAYGAFEPYVPPQKSPEQAALEMEALSYKLLNSVMEIAPDELAGDEMLSLDALRRNARHLFRLFDQDHSNSIDFDEYKQMLAYRKINLLESKARRYFQLVDDQKKGYIDEREFVVAMYVTNYLRLHQASGKSQNLSPSDVFHQLDADRDSLLNVFEYEKALELLGVPKRTQKDIAKMRSHFPRSADTITLEQFKRAWAEQIDVHAELKRHEVSLKHSGKDTTTKKEDPQSQSMVAARLSRFPTRIAGAEANRLRQALIDVIDEEERQELDVAHMAKAEALQLEKELREAEQEESRKAFKQQRQDATKARTIEAIRERQEMIQRKKERVIKDKQAKEERRLVQKATDEAAKRASHEMQVTRELMASKIDMVTLAKAKSGDDAVNLRGRQLKELPSSLYLGRDALSSLSSLLILDLADNRLEALPSAIFSHLIMLQVMNVSGNKLGELPVEIGEANDLQVLNLRNNRLRTLPSSSISKLQRLKVLDLAFNQLLKFGDECEGGGLPALEELDLTSNPLETLTEAVGSLGSLQRLTLRGDDKLRLLPGRLQHLSRLVVWDCSACRLRRIGRGALGPTMISLRRLDLSFNALSSLPASCGQLTQIQELDLRENEFVSFPTPVCELATLVALDCRRNQIENLPVACGQMVALETLRLAHNAIQELPPTVGLLTALRMLNVSNNRIASVPLELGALIHLRELNLSWNQIESLPEELGCLAALETLDVSHNRFEQLPDSIAMWQNLHRLSCSDNRFANPLTPSIRSLQALQYLDLSKNRLTVLESCVYELESLEVLNLNGNRIERLPKEMNGHCLALRKLDLYGNKVAALPLELANRLLSQLEVFVIEGNPLSLLPAKWSAQWLLQDQFKTSFAQGYTSVEAKDWTRDCADWYPAIVDVWREITSTNTSHLTDGENAVSPLSGATFVTRVRDRMGEDAWKPRYERMILHYFYEFKHVGHAIAFHEIAHDQQQQDRAAEQGSQKLRDERANQAIAENNAFRARLEEAYSVGDPVEAARAAKETRRKHEHELLARSRLETAKLNDEVAKRLPLSKQRQQDRHERERAAFMQEVRQQARDRMEQKRRAQGATGYAVRTNKIVACDRDEEIVRECADEG